MADCQEAIKLNPDNIKAYFRGAKAANCVGKYKEALSFCASGLEVSLFDHHTCTQMQTATKLNLKIKASSEAQVVDSDAPKTKQKHKSLYTCRHLL